MCLHLRGFAAVEVYLHIVHAHSREPLDARLEVVGQASLVFLALNWALARRSLLLLKLLHLLAGICPSLQAARLIDLRALVDGRLELRSLGSPWP